MEVLIVGPSRVGKSHVVEKLMKNYEVGMIASLAGSQATVPALIGGTHPNTGAITAGLLPRNHKHAVAFEELSKANPELLQHLTDVRSSGKARISRVTGTAEFPAEVRTLYISNTRASKSGESKPISSYPNGIEVVTELVGTAEDIARFDKIYVIGESAKRDINPL
jgi:hypothetical protein